MTEHNLLHKLFFKKSVIKQKTLIIEVKPHFFLTPFFFCSFVISSFQKHETSSGNVYSYEANEYVENVPK